MRKMPPRIAQGQAGVYAVAAQLLLRGINVCFPAVDRGSDLTTDWGTRIQVKCGHRRYGAWGGSYHFCLDSGQTLYTRGDGYAKGKRLHKRMFSEECDFFVMWGIEDNFFWIVPAAALDGKTTAVMMSPKTPWLTVDYDSIRYDHNAGMSYRDIEQKYRVGQKTVHRALHGHPSKTDQQLEQSRLLLEHKDRWDLIQSYERMMSEGESESSDLVQETSVNEFGVQE